MQSLSARRAWIEIRLMKERTINWHVALRKESVDRNGVHVILSAIRRVALRKESVDRNRAGLVASREHICRSPQGERG